RVERRHVRPVDLDEVPGRIADVHLHPAGGGIASTLGPRLAVEDAAALRLPVHRLEVVDVDGDVMRAWRLHVVALEQVELLVAEREPEHGRFARRRRYASQ